jgi:hypothetical protein
MPSVSLAAEEQPSTSVKAAPKQARRNREKEAPTDELQFISKF